MVESCLVMEVEEVHLMILREEGMEEVVVHLETHLLAAIIGS